MYINKACGSFGGFQLSQTFGTAYETDKDRAKREIMEFMPPVSGDDKIIVIDPESEIFVDEAGTNKPCVTTVLDFSSAKKQTDCEGSL